MSADVMQTLRRGSKGPEVRRWQQFLVGLGLYAGEVDGSFGAATESATKKFQKDHGLGADGIVGNETLGRAMVEGLEIVRAPATRTDTTSSGWPSPPRNLAPLSLSQKKKLFGDFDFKSSPRPGMPEAIEILGGWQRENVVPVVVPQLVGVKGAPRTGTILFHRQAAPQLLELVSAWSDAGLVDRVLSWAGSWVPRFVRGSRTTLSNHAWGTAFDICAEWNGLGARPALVGAKGSVRELVPLANEHGFFWGGHYLERPDGMHFECVRID